MSVILNGVKLTNSTGSLSAFINHFDASHTHTPSTTHLHWSLHIDGHDEFVFEDRTLRAAPSRFYLEGFSFPEPLHHWTELAGRVLEWHSPDDFGEGAKKPSHYIQAHSVIKCGTIRFVEHRNNQLRVQWEGISADFGAFAIDIWVPFAGVDIVHGDEDARTLLSHHFAPEDFIEEPCHTKYRSESTTHFAPKGT